MTDTDVGDRVRARAMSGQIPVAMLAESRARLRGHDLTGAAESDPAVALALLARARTATVVEAVEVLGRDGISAAVEPLEVYDPLVDADRPPWAPDRFRLHSVDVRDLVDRLAQL